MASTTPVTKLPEDKYRCIMIRKNGVRCARKHVKGYEYCSSHKKKDVTTPSVTILQEGAKVENKEVAKPIKQKKVEKKEKMQKIEEQEKVPKVEKKDKPKAEEQANKMIKHEVQIIEVKGIPYYIDNKDNVYKHDTIYMLNPVIIGKMNRQDMQIAFKIQDNLVSA